MRRQAATAIEGMVAGLAGPAAMTVSQRIEMAITGRGASNVPGGLRRAATGVAGLQQAVLIRHQRFSYRVQGRPS